jgi:hypothetical protein
MWNTAWSPRLIALQPVYSIDLDGRMLYLSRRMSLFMCDKVTPESLMAKPLIDYMIDGELVNQLMG